MVEKTSASPRDQNLPSGVSGSNSEFPGGTVTAVGTFACYAKNEKTSSGEYNQVNFGYHHSDNRCGGFTDITGMEHKFLRGAVAIP